MPSEAGLVAGQFRVIVRLGGGGMGEVFLAEQVGLDRKVVLKLVHAHLFANRRIFVEPAQEGARSAGRPGAHHERQGGETR